MSTNYPVIYWLRSCSLCSAVQYDWINSSLPIFWLPVPGKHIYVREIKLHPLTFVNTAIIIANGTEGVLSTLVTNGTGTVSTIVAKGSERVKHVIHRSVWLCVSLAVLTVGPVIQDKFLHNMGVVLRLQVHCTFSALLTGSWLFEWSLLADSRARYALLPDVGLSVICCHFFSYTLAEVFVQIH